MILSVTGHRPERIHIDGVAAYPEPYKQWDNYPYARLVDFWAAVLLKLKPKEVITGGALGTDQAAAQAALYLGIPYVVAMPFKGQENMWSDSGKVYYRYLLDNSIYVKLVNEGGFSPAKMISRNKWMVDHSDKVAALWDGTDKGGTAQAVKYATEKGMDVVNYWNAWEKRKSDGFEFDNNQPVTIIFKGKAYSSVQEAFNSNPVEGIDNQIALMKELVKAKFSQPEFSEKLGNTAERVLINWTDDELWGVNPKSGKGENKLGLLIMEARSEGI